MTPHLYAPPGWDYRPENWSKQGFAQLVALARHDGGQGQTQGQTEVNVQLGGLEGLSGVHHGRSRLRVSDLTEDLVDARPVKLRSVPLWGTSDSAVDAKIRILTEKVVRPALRDYLPWTRQLLSTVLAHAPSKANGHNKRAEARVIFEWIRRAVRYVNDPTDEELFTEIPILLKRGIGDCDDFAVLTAILFKAAGIPARLRVIQPRNARSWAHIYTLGFIDGKWVPYDSTEPFWPGWEYPRPKRLRDYEVTNG